jgi:hypothetical protein
MEQVDRVDAWVDFPKLDALVLGSWIPESRWGKGDWGTRGREGREFVWSDDSTPQSFQPAPTKHGLYEYNEAKVNLLPDSILTLLTKHKAANPLKRNSQKSC